MTRLQMPSRRRQGAVVTGAEPLGVAAHAFMQRVDDLAPIDRCRSRHCRVDRNLLPEARPRRLAGRAGHRRSAGHEWFRGSGLKYCCAGTSRSRCRASNRHDREDSRRGLRPQSRQRLQERSCRRSQRRQPGCHRRSSGRPDRSCCRKRGPLCLLLSLHQSPAGPRAIHHQRGRCSGGSRPPSPT